MPSLSRHHRFFIIIYYYYHYIVIYVIIWVWVWTVCIAWPPRHRHVRHLRIKFHETLSKQILGVRCVRRHIAYCQNDGRREQNLEIRNFWSQILRTRWCVGTTHRHSRVQNWMRVNEIHFNCWWCGRICAEMSCCSRYSGIGTIIFATMRLR